MTKNAQNKCRHYSKFYLTVSTFIKYLSIFITSQSITSQLDKGHLFLKFFFYLLSRILTGSIKYSVSKNAQNKCRPYSKFNLNVSAFMKYLNIFTSSLSISSQLDKKHLFVEIFFNPLPRVLTGKHKIFRDEKCTKKM